MSRGNSCGNRDPIDNPEYLRDVARRLIKIAKTIADPEIKKELAAHSFQLAQRAEEIVRITEHPKIRPTNVECYQAILGH